MCALVETTHPRHVLLFLDDIYLSGQTYSFAIEEYMCTARVDIFRLSRGFG